MRTYLDTMKHESVLLGPVDRHLQLTLSDERDGTVIHPSEMASSTWCPRATWCRLTGQVRTRPGVTLRTNLIFATGDDTHEKWQRWTTEMGILWGRWRCAVCEKTVLEWSNALEVSPCQARLGFQPHIWRYLEVPLVDPAANVAGHADGIVNPTGDEPLVMEIKSVGPGTIRKLDLLTEDESDDVSSVKFSKISRPDNTHFRQLQIYLRLADCDDIKDKVGPISRGVFVYEHKADQQVREFVIARNDRWTDPLFETVDDINWAIGQGREVRCPYGGCAECRSYE